MSRTRLIKPAFFKHAELYEAEAESGYPLRVAFAGLWTVADREGRFRWKADLKPDVLPYDPVDILDVLVALERGGFVRSYEVDGKRYGIIPSFSEHQTFHKTERPSTLPPPPPPHGGHPLINGEGTVRDTAVTGTVAVTGTSNVVGGGEKIAGVLIGQPADYALAITIAANNAVTRKWGEQPSPFVHGASYELTQALQDAGVPLDTAKASVLEQCEKSGRSAPPKSINWFRPGILMYHQTLEQRQIQAANPPEAAAGDALDRWLATKKAEEVRSA